MVSRNKGFSSIRIPLLLLLLLTLGGDLLAAAADADDDGGGAAAKMILPPALGEGVTAKADPRTVVGEVDIVAIDVVLHGEGVGIPEVVVEVESKLLPRLTTVVGGGVQGALDLGGLFLEEDGLTDFFGVLVLLDLAVTTLRFKGVVAILFLERCAADDVIALVFNAAAAALALDTFAAFVVVALFFLAVGAGILGGPVLRGVANDGLVTVAGESNKKQSSSFSSSKDDTDVVSSNT
jgi:hypothetical protein